MKNQKKAKEINIKDREIIKEKSIFKKLLKVSYEVYNFRILSGLKQNELAKKIGTTQKMISKIENSEINFGVNSILKMVDALNIPFRFGEFSQNINDNLDEQNHEVQYKHKSFRYDINEDYSLGSFVYSSACEDGSSSLGKFKEDLKVI